MGSHPSKTTRVLGAECFRCRYRLDAATHLHRTPKPGDVSLCLNCGALAVFDEQLQLREPTPDEKARLTVDERITRAQIYRAAVISKDLRRR